MIKKIILNFTIFLSYFWILIPNKFRTIFIRGILLIDSRNDPGRALKNLFLYEDFVNALINERSLRYGNKRHPKHNLINYHKFFIENIEEGSRVIDVGCGSGEVSYSVVNYFQNVEVLGLDIDPKKIQIANDKYNHKRLNFKIDDATISLPEEKWEIIILSNVLEHIDERVLFLKMLVKNISPKKILIRVPSFERHWSIPFRRELNINYFNDNTHFIEHTNLEFKNEINMAGLKIVSMKNIWGEIWSCCEPNN